MVCVLSQLPVIRDNVCEYIRMVCVLSCLGRLQFLFSFISHVDAAIFSTLEIRRWADEHAEALGLAELEQLHVKSNNELMSCYHSSAATIVVT